MSIKKYLGLGVLLALSQQAMAGGRPAEPTVSDRLSAALPSATLGMRAGAMSPRQCEVDDDASFKPALVFNNANLLAQSDAFSFANVLNKIIASSPRPATTPVNLLRSMLSPFNANSQDNGNVGMDTDVRPGEAQLNPFNLLNDMKPVAAFNRFDLAAADGSHCGEYRIAYGMQSSRASGRFFLIFEAQYPNPQPQLGLSGCTPVVNLWSEQRVLDNVSQLNKLEQFFFSGTTQDGVNLPAVVNFNNFSQGSGQVRTNHFINGVKWQLREFRTSVAGLNTSFSVDTVKANPLTELYKDPRDVVRTTNLSLSSATSFSNAFKQEFLDEYLRQLLSPEFNGSLQSGDIVNGIHFGVDDKFNEFQSDAQGSSDVPSVIRGSSFAAALDERLRDFDVSTQHLMNRADAMTCGGCHQTSNNRPISPTVNWPSSLGFVHVDERGNLSRAVNDVFLPARKKVMESFLCEFSNDPFEQVPSNFHGIVLRDSTVRLFWEPIEDQSMCEFYEIRVNGGRPLPGPTPVPVPAPPTEEEGPEQRFRPAPSTNLRVPCDASAASLRLPPGFYTISINAVFDSGLGGSYGRFIHGPKAFTRVRVQRGIYPIER